ncbi:choice-of-anchor D domain-containing protein [Rubritalea spongiae]|uniref:Choice-of-anchor D domain-containing protein n=1 Tax=Rubritalea spongiae TaxID=430797 RepID=A0ABW5DY25_9BACT
MKKSYILLLPVLVLLTCFSYLSLKSTNNTVKIEPQSLDTSKPQRNFISPLSTDLFKSAVYTESAPPLPVQRQELVKNSETIVTEVSETEHGYKQSSLLKTDFKYSHVQRDIFINKQGEYLKSEYFVADHVLIKFPSEFSTKEIYNWAKLRGYHVRNKLKTDSIYLIATEAPQLFDTQNLINQFEQDFHGAESLQIAGIAEKDFIYTTQATTPNDTSYSSLWGLNNTGQTGGSADADIDAPEAWDITTGSSNVTVAVIDTGVDLDHLDLADNIWTNPNEIAGNGIDDDNNGFIDDVHGWDFRNDDSNPDDDDDHGTHCSGTIGAVGNNGSGVAGVAWDVSIVPIKFLGPSGGTTSDAIDSVNYATSLGVDLTSNSWGGGGYSSLLENAIQTAGNNNILFIAAAGNDSSNNDISPQYPCSYTIDSIISVASTTHSDALSSFSNYGATTVDLGAPGSNIYSTVRNGGYASFSGTSMATPHVAGVVCLIKSIAPELGALEIKQQLLNNTDPIAALQGISLSGGRINAFSTLSQLTGSYTKVATIDIEFTSGNGDDYINPGETGNIVVTFKNIGTEDALNASAQIFPSQPVSGITIDTQSINIGTIPAGSISSEHRISFEVAANAATPQSHLFDINLSDDLGTGQTYASALSIYTSATISGNVFSLENNSPVAGALVSAVGEISVSSNTDVNGNFSLNVVDGDFDIQASATGFMNSEVLTASVPPSLSGLSIGLGIPDLQISPNSISESVYAGTSITTDLILSNNGTAPVDWSLLTKKFTANQASSRTLLAREVPTKNPDSKTPGLQSKLVLNSTQSDDLTGVTLGHIGSTSSYLMNDAESLGAQVINVTFPINSSILNSLDALFIDDSVSSASSSDITTIRDWVANGGGLMLTGDSTTINNNALLAQTGIHTAFKGNYTTETITDISSDPITDGVETVFLSAYGTTCTIVSPAKSLMRSNTGSSVMAVAPLGAGNIIYLANELNASSSLDGRGLALNSASYLSGGSSWLFANPTSGSISAGQTETVTVTIDATNAIAGLLEGEIIISSNDLANDTQTIPVQVNVVGAAAIVTDINSYDFGSAFIGGTYSTELTISNPGTNNLIISSTSFSGASYSSSLNTPLTISPKEEETIQIDFNPLTIGMHNGTFSIHSNSPTTPIHTVSFAGEGAPAPVLSLSNKNISVSVPFKSSHDETLTLKNTGGANLIWQSSERLNSAHSKRSLSDTLDALDTNYETITDLIPNRFDFSGGDSGHYIADGGSDMYDYGNYLETNLSNSSIFYSNNHIRNDPDFGENGSYFTRKYPGLFVLGAELDSIDHFKVSGSLGADGRGYQDSAAITTTYLGTSYTGYIKRVFNAGTPSVNHLIIVPTDSSISQLTGSTTESDQHELHNLTNTESLYYLLFSSTEGDYIDDATMLSIMEEFLVHTAIDVDWFSASSYNGSTAPSESEAIQIDFTPNKLSAGTYTAELLFDSNDPVTPQSTVTLSMTVTSRPIISLAESSIDFGNVTNNTSSQTLLTIDNIGDEPLTINNLSLPHSDFSIIGASSFEIQPNSSRDIPITFNPSSSGPQTTTLTISHNGDQGSTTVNITGSSVTYTGIISLPSSLEYTVEAGSLQPTQIELNSSHSHGVYFYSTSQNPSTGNGLALSRAKVGILATSNTIDSSLVTILENEGALISHISSSETLLSTTLQNLDFIVVGSSLESMNYTNLQTLKNWLTIGGRIFIYNSSSTHTDQSTLVSDFGFNPDYQYNSNTPSSQWNALSPSHQITVNRSILSVNDSSYSYHHKFTITDSTIAQGIYEDSLGYIRAVAAEKGNSKVISIGHLVNSSTFTNDPNKVQFLTSCWAWLMGGHPYWIRPTQVDGYLSPGGSHTYPITLDATDLIEGQYSANLLIKSASSHATEITVPINLTVIGSPTLAPSHQEILFDQTVLGKNQTKVIQLRNSGSSPLTLSSISSGSADFTTDFSSPLTLQPGASTDVAITFTPQTAKLYEEELSVTSNDPNTPTLSISLRGRAIGAPEIQTPDSISFTAISGEVSSTSFSIHNAGQSNLDWTLLPLKEIATPSLEQILQTLNTRSDELLTAIPSPYLFTDGELGYDIVDGGEDMFNTGNELETNYDSSIPYSNFQIESTNGDFGPEGAYFTAKLPGVFVLCADLDNISYFGIDGGVGGGSSGSISVSDFTHNQAGVEYRVFTKKVYGKDSPSVNHLIILENHPDLTRAYNASPAYDDHKLTGTSNNTRVYFLMFGQENGGEVPDATFQNIAANFLSLIHFTENDQLTVSPKQGSTIAASNDSISLDFNAQTSYAGTFQSLLRVGSNDLNLPVKNIPIKVTVTGTPEIASSSTYMNFPATVIGLDTELDLEISNTGTSDLSISSLTINNSLFSTENNTLNIAPGESSIITISYTPHTNGFESAALSINSNAATNSTHIVYLSGLGILPPSAVVDSSQRNYSLGANSALFNTLEIENSGSSNLEWSAYIDYGMAANNIGTPQYDGLKTLAIDYSENANSYEYIKNYITSSGGIFTTMADNNFEPSELAKYDVVLLGSSASLSAVDYSAINTWVYAGGSLLYDYAGSYSSTAASNLLQGTDITAVPATNSGYETLTNFEYHAITYNVQSIYGYVYINFELTGNATPLATTENNAIFSAATSYGNGKIVCNADSLADASSTKENNRQFIENTILWLGNKQRGWLNLTAQGGNLAPGSTLNIPYKINSSNLTLGTYNADIVITTNDPSHSEIRVPISTTVTNAAEITTDVDAMYFDATIVNAQSHQMLTVTNPGFTPLTIHSVTGSGDFHIDTSLPITITPQTSQKISVTFTPSSVNLHEEVLTINSNALSHPAKQIALSGISIAAPKVILGSSAITINRSINESSSYGLTLTNGGSSVLSWKIREFNNFSSVPDNLAGSSIGLLTSSTASFPEFRTILTNYGANIINISSNITPESLELIDVLIYDGSNMLSTPSIETIAEWINNGGALLACDDATNNMNLLLAPFGSSLTHNYGSYYTPLSAVGDHVIVSNIRTVDAYYPDAILNTPAHATPLLEYSDQSIAGATYDHGLGKVIFLSYEAMYYRNFSSGNGENFITNCVAYLSSQIPWLNIPSIQGDILAGANSSIYLHIDTNGLNQGSYTGNILITSNDPTNSAIQVPLTLNVLPVFPQAAYDTWLGSHLSGESQHLGFHEDFDRDNLTNGEEFYFSTNPKNRKNGNNLPAVKMSNSGPVLTYTRTSELSDHMLLWESSNNLSSWEPHDMSAISSAVSKTLIDNGDGTTTVTLLLDRANQSSQFFRYKIWSGNSSED